MAPGKKKVDWSCSICTLGAKAPQKGANANKTGHLNYASDDWCRKCKTPKGSCHLCADADLGPKLKGAFSLGASKWDKGHGPDAGGKGSKGGGKGGGGKTQREKELEKENSDLRRQMKLDKGKADTTTDAATDGGGADGGPAGGPVIARAEKRYWSLCRSVSLWVKLCTQSVCLCA